MAVAPLDAVVDEAVAGVAPEITYLQNRIADPSSLTLLFPGQTDPSTENGIFGPNFTFEAIIPEPATFLLLALGGAALGLRRYQRQRDDAVSHITLGFSGKHQASA